MPEEKRKMKKLTVELPEDLWKRASHHAVDADTNLKRMIVEGLELLLAKEKSKEKGGRR